MTTLSLTRRKVPSIGDLRHRVIICTWVERPDGDISVIKERPGVFACQARILPLQGTTVLDFQSILGAEFAPTHEITIRTPRDVLLDAGHWVFHDDCQRAAWYRVRRVEDMAAAKRFTILSCSLDSFSDRRRDPATQQAPCDFERPSVPEPGC